MSSTLTRPVPAPRPAPRRGSGPAAAIYVAIAAAVAGAWFIVQATGLRAGSDAGYWLGVATGVVLLLLFAYPLRKRVRFMARWGMAKWWFAVHMTLGIGVAVLVLVHSTFHIGSVNAGVALYSMLVVAGSGVVGRFLYLHVHRGLSGERETIAHLHHALGLKHDSVHAAVAGTREVEEELLAFERFALAAQARGARHLRAFTLVPLRRRRLQAHCARALKAQVRTRAMAQRWTREAARAEYRKQRSSVEDYLFAVQRAAQFQSATRLFSLWHVLHVPIVYVMVLSVVAHVIAVHAY